MVSTPSPRTRATDWATTNPVLMSVSDRLIRNGPRVALDASSGVNVPASRYCALPTLDGAHGHHVELRELVGSALQQSGVEGFRRDRLLAR